MSWFFGLHPVLQALLATVGTWILTMLGASLVFFTKHVSRKYLDSSLGFAAGVMTAASFWSLLAPAIEMAAEAGYGKLKWIPPVVGFLLGAGFLRLTDRLLPHMHPDFRTVEGIKTQWHRATLLVLAITLHNIPEGLAVGVAFGAARDAASRGGALALAIGIGLQNFPEGTAVSLPLAREGMSRWRAFIYGQASALVEPMAGMAGAYAVLHMRPVLPYALAFAAGAMIFVVAEELIPEAHRGQYVHLATTGFILGFAVMMSLDVALG